MGTFWIYTVTGVVAGGIYAISAAGLVVTYITSRVFNFAHGAVGMIVAFIYADLRLTYGWSQWAALAVCVLVIAPALGVALDVTLMRRLRGLPVAISLMVTLALYQVLTGIAETVWGTNGGSVPGLFTGSFSPVPGLNVTYDGLTILIVSIAIVFGLGVYFKRTRMGTTMRAVVDNRTLGEMNGISTSRVTSLSWALGSSLAALAAILIVPLLTLSIQSLSLLVVSTYAAAVLGRLRSLPLTFLGAMLLGLMTSYVTGYLPYSNQLVQQIGPAMPFIVLFITLIVLSADREAQFEKVEFASAGRPPRRRTTLIVGAVLLAAVAGIAPELSGSYALVLGIGLVYALILLSLVLITGMSGQVSLAQLSFVGIGAVLLPHFAHYMPWAVAALLCTAITALAGALLALPTLRLQGLYFALSTLAFAVLVDNIFFPNTHLISPTTQDISAPPPGIGSVVLRTAQSQLWLLALLVVLYMLALFGIRRRAYGRALTAMRDAPAAASTLGLSLTSMKITVFAVSAGMAGLAGCFYAGLLGQVSGSLFNYGQSMAVLLILAIYGLSSVPGALLGAVLYVVTFQLAPTWFHDPTLTSILNTLQPLFIGLGVLNLVLHPEGMIAQTAGQYRWLVRKREQRRIAASKAGAGPALDAVQFQVIASAKER